MSDNELPKGYASGGKIEEPEVFYGRVGESGSEEIMSSGLSADTIPVYLDGKKIAEVPRSSMHAARCPVCGGPAVLGDACRHLEPPETEA